MLISKSYSNFFYRLSVCLLLLQLPHVNANEALEVQQAIDAYQERSWEFGLSVGYGQRTNPLANSSDIPLYAVFNMAWYGDWLFFDNGDLGLNFYENDQLSLNLISHVNNERGVFEWFNKGVRIFGFPSASGTSNFDNEPSTASSQVPGDPSEMEETPILIEIPDRNIAVDIGGEIMYANNWGEVQLQLLSDISFQHKGFEIWAAYSYPWHYGNWSFVPSVGFVWKSKRLLDYYYGVRDDEVQEGLPAYRAKSGTNAFVRLTATYRLSQHWGIVGVFEYESLNASIQNSPLIDSESIETYFIGLTYQF